MKLTNQAIRVVLLASIGCSAGDDKVVGEHGSPMSSDGHSLPEPPWIFPTTSYSPTTDAPGEDDRLEIQIAAEGRLTFGVPGSRVDVTLDEIDRHLQERRDGDLFEDGLIVRRMIVAIEVAPSTPWSSVRSVMRLCEVWRHRRVVLGVGSQRMKFHLPPNTTQHYPPMPDDARVRLTLRRVHATSTATVRFDSRWSDLESFRTRSGDIAKRATQLPAVAVLDIGRDVRSDEVVKFLGILVDAGIGRFMYKQGMPPR